MSSRSKNGRVVLRLEDLDTSRARDEYIDACIEDLTWLGLDWDEEPLLQSSRAEELMKTVQRLASDGQAYPCVCTRREVREAISAPHQGEGPDRYPGTCRGRFSSTEEARTSAGRSPAIRFKCPEAEVLVNDSYMGSAKLNPAEEFGDFPIASPDGQVSYHLAVVLDDHHQGVTEVLRGDDLHTSSGPQALLQDALEIPRPEWIHVPLLMDESGQRLAKRSDSLSLRSLREAGVDSGRLVQWLLSQSGLPVNGPCTPEDALPAYKLSLINPEAIRVPAEIHRILSEATSA